MARQQMHDMSQSMIASKLELSPVAISVLEELFVSGPTSDGNICSKAGRGELVRGGLAVHGYGWASLTPDGVRLAKEWDMVRCMRAAIGVGT
jgi:hypothetical protein